mmetsp:Transcript_30873/g.98507  ORF Transcript_30873/g.98507 Transcript_30873/m.98507 type:complete len:378 (+) Transcript_30873:3693-4826(+)
MGQHADGGSDGSEPAPPLAGSGAGDRPRARDPRSARARRELSEPEEPSVRARAVLLAEAKVACGRRTISESFRACGLASSAAACDARYCSGTPSLLTSMTRGLMETMAVWGTASCACSCVLTPSTPAPPPSHASPEWVAACVEMGVETAPRSTRQSCASCGSQICSGSPPAPAGTSTCWLRVIARFVPSNFTAIRAVARVSASRRQRSESASARRRQPLSAIARSGEGRSGAAEVVAATYSRLTVVWLMTAMSAHTTMRSGWFAPPSVSWTHTSICSLSRTRARNLERFGCDCSRGRRPRDRLYSCLRSKVDRSSRRSISAQATCERSIASRALSRTSERGMYPALSSSPACAPRPLSLPPPSPAAYSLADSIPSST